MAMLGMRCYSCETVLFLRTTRYDDTSSSLVFYSLSLLFPRSSLSLLVSAICFASVRYPVGVYDSRRSFVLYCIFCCFIRFVSSLASCFVWYVNAGIASERACEFERFDESNWGRVRLHIRGPR